MIKMKNQVNKYSAQIIPLLKKNDVSQAGIFGSVARGEDTKRSDIDILIKFKKRKSIFEVAGLELELEKKLKRKVDLITYNSLSPFLKARILQEEVRII